MENKRAQMIMAACLSVGALSYSSMAVSKELSVEGFNTYVEGVKQEAIKKGYSEELVERAYKGATFKKKIIKADKSQPEKKLTLDQYLPKVTASWKVKQGKALLKKHKVELERIGKKYGVQPRFIVALWGVESIYGKYMGKHSVVGALTTMAYEGRREKFFRAQIFDALKILQQGHIAPEKMKGSWAGAMGQCQFMPSSFLSYAQDGNGDGQKDIWGTKADVFASTANYLHMEGWQEGYTWGRQVRLTKSVPEGSVGIKKEQGKTLSEWEALGVRRLNGNSLPKVKGLKAWLIQPDDKHGRAYLVYQNYQTLMHWNRSHYFALAVSHLADKLSY